MIQSISGQLGLGHSNFNEYLEMIKKTNLVKLENVDVIAFLKDQVMNLCESMSSIESFLKEVEGLITLESLNVL